MQHHATWCNAKVKMLFVARRLLARHIDAQEGKEHNSLAKLRDEAKKWGYSRAQIGVSRIA
jgi:hypothetical protein